MAEWKQLAEAVRYEINRNGDVRNRVTGKILKQQIVGKTPVVYLQDAGVALCRSVPKLVKKTFGS